MSFFRRLLLDMGPQFLCRLSHVTVEVELFAGVLRPQYFHLRFQLF